MLFYRFVVTMMSSEAAFSSQITVDQGLNAATRGLMVTGNSRARITTAMPKFLLDDRYF